MNFYCFLRSFSLKQIVCKVKVVVIVDKVFILLSATKIPASNVLKAHEWENFQIIRFVLPEISLTFY